MFIVTFKSVKVNMTKKKKNAACHEQKPEVVKFSVLDTFPCWKAYVLLPRSDSFFKFYINVS